MFLYPVTYNCPHITKAYLKALPLGGSRRGSVIVPPFSSRLPAIEPAAYILVPAALE